LIALVGGVREIVSLPSITEGVSLSGKQVMRSFDFEALAAIPNHRRNPIQIVIWYCSAGLELAIRVRSSARPAEATTELP
jgi:hypothetical protein